MSRIGSGATDFRRSRDVRFSPESDRVAASRYVTLWASALNCARVVHSGDIREPEVRTEQPPDTEQFRAGGE